MLSLAPFARAQGEAMFARHSLLLQAAAVLAVAVWASAAHAQAFPWRAGWCGLKDPEKLVACAKLIGFNALIAHSTPERMVEFSELARQSGIESYYWFSLSFGGKEREPFRQVMEPGDDKQFVELNADADPAKHGYQFGGEPVPGNHDVLLTPLLCFHRPEVKAFAQQQIRERLEVCPALTGVAFDYFGYQNYRCCHCPQSEKLFAEYRQAHPDLPPDKALDQFSLETLVTFNNELATYVRQLRPGAKLATHVYPVFLPQPLYGNQLDVDYCCQTVAWFFQPYWSAEKIRQYTHTVVDEQARYHPRAVGIPFVGGYVGRPFGDKSPERLAEELRVIWEAGKTSRLSVCSFNEFVDHPEVRLVVKQALSEQQSAASEIKQ